MDNKHCYYFVISELCQKLNVYLNQIDIFNLLGGHSFVVKKDRNENFPLLKIKGSILDDRHFRIFTGFFIERKVFSTIEEAIEITIQGIRKKSYQTVRTNCFFLPYDSTNYKKNIGPHYIILSSFDSSTNRFILSDHKYDIASLRMEDLKLAMVNLSSNKNCLLNLKNENEFRFCQIKDSVREIIKSNAKRILSTGQDQFSFLTKEIENINSLESFYRSFSYFELLKSIKNPNGPIVSRHYLLRSLPGNNKTLHNIISESIQLWERFCVDVYKNYKYDSPLPLGIHLNNLYKLEMDINKKILNYL